jgi:hypothetical protein
MFCIARFCYLFLSSKDFGLDHGVECGGLLLIFSGLFACVVDAKKMKIEREKHA